MKLTKNDYVALVSSASPLGLVIINYELVLQNIHEAKEILEAGDEERFRLHVDRAREFLMILMSSLDMTFDISGELMQLYLFANRQLIEAAAKNDTSLLCNACDMLGSLLDAWRVLKREESNAPPVMDNVEQLIAGVTYKDGQLSEYVINGENRGILA